MNQPDQSTNQVTHRNVQTVEQIEKEADEQRTWGERFVDSVATLVGNERFFAVHAIWIAGWLLLNAGIISGIRPFDPYPWPALLAIVSLEATLIACVVLMLQGRMKQQNARQAHLHLQVAMLAEAEATKTLILLRALCRDRGLEEANDPELADLIDRTEHSKLMDQVEETLIAK